MGAGWAAAADTALGVLNASISGASAYNARKEYWQKGETAHQIEVRDLQAAGLNPVLSAGGPGAPTSMGPTAQSNIPGKFLESYQAKSRLAIDKQLADANTRLINANILSTEAQARRTTAEEENIRLNMLNNPLLMDKVGAETKESKSRALNNYYDSRRKAAFAPAWDAAGEGINVILQSYPGMIDWVARKLYEREYPKIKTKKPRKGEFNFSTPTPEG